MSEFPSRYLIQRQNASHVHSVLYSCVQTSIEGRVLGVVECFVIYKSVELWALLYLWTESLILTYPSTMAQNRISHYSNNFWLHPFKTFFAPYQCHYGPNYIWQEGLHSFSCTCITDIFLLSLNVITAGVENSKRCVNFGVIKVTALSLGILLGSLP